MAALADLAPDRRAVLQLLVGRGRSYEQIADLLSAPEIVVRRRAHAAIAELAGETSLSDEQRMLLSDYLVGELPASRRGQARKLLSDDPAARRFARAAAARLSGIKDAQLPELPDEDEEVAEALDALDKRRERTAELETNSRKGAWLLVGAVAFVVTAAVVTLATLAGGSDDPGTEITQNDRPSDSASTTPAGVVVADLKSPSGGKASGEAAIKYPASGPVDFGLIARNLPDARTLPGGKFTAYAVWLDGPGVDPLRLGFYDPAGDADASAEKKTIAMKLNGKTTPAVEASDLDQYTEVLVSRETLSSTQDRPERPGTIVLEGRLSTGEG